MFHRHWIASICNNLFNKSFHMMIELIGPFLFLNILWVISTLFMILLQHISLSSLFQIHQIHTPSLTFFLLAKLWNFHSKVCLHNLGPKLSFLNVSYFAFFQWIGMLDVLSNRTYFFPSPEGQIDISLQLFLLNISCCS